MTRDDIYSSQSFWEFYDEKDKKLTRKSQAFGEKLRKLCFCHLITFLEADCL